MNPKEKMNYSKDKINKIVRIHHTSTLKTITLKYISIILILLLIIAFILYYLLLTYVNTQAKFYNGLLYDKRVSGNPYFYEFAKANFYYYAKYASDDTFHSFHDDYGTIDLQNLVQFSPYYWPIENQELYKQYIQRYKKLNNGNLPNPKIVKEEEQAK
jgi:hypothetical protein